MLLRVCGAACCVVLLRGACLHAWLLRAARQLVAEVERGGAARTALNEAERVALFAPLLERALAAAPHRKTRRAKSSADEQQPTA